MEGSDGRVAASPGRRECCESMAAVTGVYWSNFSKVIRSVQKAWAARDRDPAVYATESIWDGTCLCPEGGGPLKKPPEPVDELPLVSC